MKKLKVLLYKKDDKFYAFCLDMVVIAHSLIGFEDALVNLKELVQLEEDYRNFASNVIEPDRSNLEDRFAEWETAAHFLNDVFDCREKNSQ